MAAAKANSVIMPIVSKMYCSSSQVVLVVRRRPHVVHGGGFVVTDCTQKVVFRVDGCGILGKDGEVVLRDANGDSLLLIRRKEGIVEALNINKHWKGYAAMNYEGSPNTVFTLKEPNSFLVKNNPIKISTKPRGCSTQWDFQTKGSFQDRTCSIIDSAGIAIAEIGIRKDVGSMMGSNDLYHVIVKPGIDQAFVFGVIAVLDYIYDGSTRC